MSNLTLCSIRTFDPYIQNFKSNDSNEGLRMNCRGLKEHIREGRKRVSLGLVCGWENSRSLNVAAASRGFIYVKCNLADRLLELAVLVVVATSSLACLNQPGQSYRMFLNKSHTFPELILSRTGLSLAIIIFLSQLFRIRQ